MRKLATPGIGQCQPCYLEVPSTDSHSFETPVHEPGFYEIDQQLRLDALGLDHGVRRATRLGVGDKGERVVLIRCEVHSAK